MDGALNSTKIVKYVTLMMTDVARSKHACKFKTAVLSLWRSLLSCCCYLDLFDEFIPVPSWRAAQYQFLSIWQCQFLSREINKVFFLSNFLFADTLSLAGGISRRVLLFVCLFVFCFLFVVNFAEEPWQDCNQVIGNFVLWLLRLLWVASLPRNCTPRMTISLATYAGYNIYSLFV